MELKRSVEKKNGKIVFLYFFYLAQQNLNNVTLYGKDMRVSRSKHDNVNMPKSEDEGRELTKDYSNSPLHRFKVTVWKNEWDIAAKLYFGMNRI